MGRPIFLAVTTLQSRSDERELTSHQMGTGMKIIVFGHKRHGKDTACEYLARVHGMTFTASSMFACKTFLFEQLRERFGYATLEECFADRENHRPLWYEAIREYNAQDRGRLGRAIFAEHDIYCGIRDREEFDCLRQEGLFDVAVWVDASLRLPAESLDSMNLSASDADIVVSNNGSLEQLEAELDRLLLSLAGGEVSCRN